MHAYRQLKVVILSIFLVSPASVLAESGFYVGASIGSADLDEDFDGLEIDTNSTAFRVTGGWSFNDIFALEAGYQGFGDFRQQTLLNGIPITVGLSADGYTFGVAGQLPVAERFFVTGRLGAFFWDGTAEINGVSQADPGDNNLYYGVGVKYALNEKFALSVDYSRFDLEDVQSDMFSFGVQYQFGR